MMHIYIYIYMYIYIELFLLSSCLYFSIINVPKNMHINNIKT